MYLRHYPGTASQRARFDSPHRANEAVPFVATYVRDRRGREAPTHGGYSADTVSLIDASLINCCGRFLGQLERELWQMTAVTRWCTGAAVAISIV